MEDRERILYLARIADLEDQNAALESELSDCYHQMNDMGETMRAQDRALNLAAGQIAGLLSDRRFPDLKVG